MAHFEKTFDFSFPLTHKIVRNLKIVTEHVGDLQVAGVASVNRNVSALSHLDERYAVDIDFVRWNGVDIKPVLELTNLMDDVQEAALRNCVFLFNDVLSQAA